VRSLPIAGAGSIVATHVLGGNFGRGRKSRASGHSNRRGGVDGHGDHGMEARVAKLEATTAHIQSDVNDLKTEVRGLRADLKSEVTSLRADLKNEVTNLRSEFRADFRMLFGAVLTVVIGMVGMLVKIFNLV